MCSLLHLLSWFPAFHLSEYKNGYTLWVCVHWSQGSWLLTTIPFVIHLLLFLLVPWFHRQWAQWNRCSKQGDIYLDICDFCLSAHSLLSDRGGQVSSKAEQPFAMLMSRPIIGLCTEGKANCHGEHAEGPAIPWRGWDVHHKISSQGDHQGHTCTVLVNAIAFWSRSPLPFGTRTGIYSLSFYLHQIHSAKHEIFSCCTFWSGEQLGLISLVTLWHLSWYMVDWSVFIRSSCMNPVPEPNGM